MPAQPQYPLEEDPGLRRAFEQAFGKMDEAIGLSRQRDDGSPPDDYQYERYLRLRADPQALLSFVAESLGTRNPDQIKAGALAYLQEMEARYGTKV